MKQYRSAPMLLRGACITCLLGWMVLAGCQWTSTGDEPLAVRAAPQVPAPGSPVEAAADEVPLIEVTALTGITFTYASGGDANECTILESLGGGIACLDYDRDGRLDLYFTGGGTIAPGIVRGLVGSLWRNAGAMRFQEVTRAAGAGADQYYTHAAVSADYDNDGFPDLLITGFGGLQLLHNEGDGTFSAWAAEAGLRDPVWSSSAAFADLDGDGNLDLYVCHYVDWSFDNHPFCRGPGLNLRDICPPKRFAPLPDSLFFSQGDGTFRDGTAAAGLVPGGKGLGVVLCDLDGDSDIDIYVANDTTDNFLYLNDGAGRFQEVGVLQGAALDHHGGANGSMGVDVGDFNHDGLPDLWVANFEQESFALYQNIGDALFQHRSEALGISALGGLFVGFGTAFVDVNADGFEDLIVSNGHVIKYPSSGSIEEPPLLLLNQQGRRFRRASSSPESYFSRLHRGRGLIVADLDDDGAPDVAISHNDQPVAILQHRGLAGAHYLRVRLVGRSANRDAIGAHLVLVTPLGELHRWVRGGASYLSQGPYEVLWGIPAELEIRQLRVTWPGGTTQILTAVPKNETWTLIEPETPRGETDLIPPS